MISRVGIGTAWSKKLDLVELPLCGGRTNSNSQGYSRLIPCLSVIILAADGAYWKRQLVDGGMTGNKLAHRQQVAIGWFMARHGNGNRTYLLVFLGPCWLPGHMQP